MIFASSPVSKISAVKKIKFQVRAGGKKLASRIEVRGETEEEEGRSKKKRKKKKKESGAQLAGRCDETASRLGSARPREN